jgi:hypothetical protein
VIASTALGIPLAQTPDKSPVRKGVPVMRLSLSVFNAAILSFCLAYVPAAGAQSPAANPIQPSPTTVINDDAKVQAPSRTLNLPAGTRLDIEASYTVTSKDFKPGDLLTFRVLVPVKIEGVDVFRWVRS